MICLRTRRAKDGTLDTPHEPLLIPTIRRPISRIQAALSPFDRCAMPSPLDNTIRTQHGMSLHKIEGMPDLDGRVYFCILRGA